MTWYIELFEIELLDHLTVNKRLMFNWIINHALQYLEPFNFANLIYISLLEIELLDHLTVCINEMSLQIWHICKNRIWL